MSFQNLHVVVTGGSGALGRSVVKLLLEQGASVHVPWVDEAELKSFPFAEKVRVGHVDLLQDEDVKRFYSEIPKLWASIHVAGGFAMSLIASTSSAELEGLFRLNAVTCFNACREAVISMRRTGQGGRIVNVIARPALAPIAGMIGYSMAKSAVAALTTALSEEVRREKILVNAVAPGVMNTPANRAAMPDADRSAWASTDEVAALLVSLASPANSLTTGALIPAFGPLA